MLNNNEIKIAIATPCYTGQLDAEVAGKIGMYLYNLGRKHPSLKLEWWIIRRSFIHTARNYFAEKAIQLGFDYIWWVDDDCLLPDNLDILPKLLSHDKDIVITPYFLRKAPHSPGVLRASDFRRPETYRNLRRDELHQGLIEVDGGGTHCMLTKVSLFKEMPRPYFALPEFGGTEDMYMCLKAKEMGRKVYCDSDIEAGHIGYPPVITSTTYADYVDKHPEVEAVNVSK